VGHERKKGGKGKDGFEDSRNGKDARQMRARDGEKGPVNIVLALDATNALQGLKDELGEGESLWGVLKRKVNEGPSGGVRGENPRTPECRIGLRTPGVQGGKKKGRRKTVVRESGKDKGLELW